MSGKEPYKDILYDGVIQTFTYVGMQEDLFLYTSDKGHTLSGGTLERLLDEQKEDHIEIKKIIEDISKVVELGGEYD